MLIRMKINMINVHKNIAHVWHELKIRFGNFSVELCVAMTANELYNLFDYSISAAADAAFFFIFIKTCNFTDLRD